MRPQLPWRTLGARIDDVDYGVDRVMIDDIERAITCATTIEYRGLLAMLHTTGARIPDGDRVAAGRLRHRVALPPWWRLRLAVRRTQWQPPIPEGS